MVSKSEASELKNNSLETAKEVGILDDEEVLQKVRDIDIEVKNGEKLEDTGQRILFGYCSLPNSSKQDPKVVVRKKNLADLLPDQFKNILNQSGMDHELIGHVGHYFLGNGENEEVACVTQFRMARQRASDRKSWYLVVLALPLFQKLHRGVSLSSYSVLRSK